MKLRCKHCHEVLESIERTANIGPPVKIHFVPFHRNSWPLTSSRKSWATCPRTYMKVLPEEIVQ
jgi:hypothetical protein